jgi:pyruvate dehydrogenase E1 component alpha subunit
VLAVYAATRDLVERVRGGGPPGFVEALTYRMAGHSTSDDPRRYRLPAELDGWQARDPLARMLAYLSAQGWADDTWVQQLDDEASQLATETRAACLALAPPLLEDTFRTTLVAETAPLRAEREQFTAYRESFL